ncbi:hypothetical protein K0M31_009239 [Melipona bicolor]|uniref:Uncharacterized protein n=1 Tax=Melipona bicolor TaxID=60889 RepID=A0AA40KJP0_9HYME|nr:hypothetical protein K0M31_009239 [Melipona bicolor]
MRSEKEVRRPLGICGTRSDKGAEKEEKDDAEDDTTTMSGSTVQPAQRDSMSEKGNGALYPLVFVHNEERSPPKRT